MLSRSAAHAVRAMLVLTELEEDRFRGASAIAEQIGAPSNYLGKLLRQLSQHSLVESQKGLGGGFRLMRPADQISLMDIIEAIDDIDRWQDCLLGGKDCDGTHACAVHERWSAVRELQEALLRDTAISDIASGARGASDSG